MSDFGEGRELIPRKPHRCEWCFEAISADEKCYQYKGMWDGEWQNWYMHRECEDSYQLGDLYGDGFTPGDGQGNRPQKLLDTVLRTNNTVVASAQAGSLN